MLDIGLFGRSRLSYLDRGSSIQKGLVHPSFNSNCCRDELSLSPHQLHPACQLLPCTLKCTQYVSYSPAPSAAPGISSTPLPPLHPECHLFPCPLSCTQRISYSPAPSAASGMSATPLPLQQHLACQLLPCPRVTGKASFLQWMSYCKLVLVSP